MMNDYDAALLVAGFFCALVLPLALLATLRVRGDGGGRPGVRRRRAARPLSRAHQLEGKDARR